MNLLFRLLFLIASVSYFPRIAAALDDSSIPSAIQIESATKLARCRATCFDAFAERSINKGGDHSNERSSTTSKSTTSNRAFTERECMDDTDCWMCWDVCTMLQADLEKWSQEICTQRAVCFEGCRIACTVYASPLIESPDPWSFPTAPVLETDARDGWLRLRWSDVVPLSTCSPPVPRLIYVVFWRSGLDGQPWMQLEQVTTTSYETRHGDIVIGGRRAEFLVLAVTRDGLVATGRPIKDGRGRMTTPSFEMENEDDSMMIVISTTSVSDGSGIVDEMENWKSNIRLVLAIVGGSLLIGLVCTILLVYLYRLIQAERRRRHVIFRQGAIRIPRRRYTSASSRRQLITDLNPVKLESISENVMDELQKCRPVDVVEEQDQDSVIHQYTPTESDRNRFPELFKGTIFESPSPYQSIDRARFTFSPSGHPQFDPAV